jgi:hypothetical protein
MRKLNSSVWMMARILLVTLALTGCATTHTSDQKVVAVKPKLTSSQIETWKLVVGTWYGSQPRKGGGQIEWIAENSIDGFYLIRFRYQEENGDIKETIEAGEWGIAGPIYFSIFRQYVQDNEWFQTDPTDPYIRDAYKIIELTEDSFVYEEFVTRNRYTAKRVSEAFDFRARI